VVILDLGALVWIRSRDDIPYQQRNLQSLQAVLIAFALLLVWWAAFSRTNRKLRLGVLGVILLSLGAGVGAFRITGVSGDLLPILEPRWSRRPELERTPAVTNVAGTDLAQTNLLGAAASTEPDFPQFLGPHRSAVVDEPWLGGDWKTSPPHILWKQPIGAAWSGFVVVGRRALTQEQRGEQELVTCYEASTGRLLWSHADPAHYQTTIAGEGPRCTPTVVGNLVYTLGALGDLNCLDLATGRRLWRRNIAADAGTKMPEWGFSGSPLVATGRVHVSAGGKPDKSMLAYDAETGYLAWTAGNSSISYSSPSVATLAGIPQILIFNSKRVTSHDLASGRVLWEYPWGIGQPHVAMPVPVGTNRVLFSSGYGVGSELLEIAPGVSNSLAARRVWKSNRMKAKFSNLVAREGFLYGLDDGVLACIDLNDGSLRWKEGRHGHGQGLLIGDLYLLMAESGELLLLKLTPTAPEELGRYRVFDAKTWNPIALSGSRLLVRNDREAACLSLPIRPR
jgi:outer membrane protein assembly factor BamB